MALSYDNEKLAAVRVSLLSTRFANLPYELRYRLCVPLRRYQSAVTTEKNRLSYLRDYLGWKRNLNSVQCRLLSSISFINRLLIFMQIDGSPNVIKEMEFEQKLVPSNLHHFNIVTPILQFLKRRQTELTLARWTSDAWCWRSVTGCCHFANRFM